MRGIGPTVEKRRSPTWCLLCRPHHRTIHRGFGVQMVDGSPKFSRPDGTTLDERAPP
jgi:hypothetical protein